MRAVLFDFDGVLVNSEPLHFRAMRECLLPEGIAIDEAEYLRTYLAYDDREAIRVALERHDAVSGPAPQSRSLRDAPAGPERVDALARRKAELFERLMGEIPFFPGARELVRSLAAEVPLAIASGALRPEIEAILEAGGLRDAFATIVGAEDVSRGKPHPEPYLTAMQRLATRAAELRPEDCLVVEDSMPGIAAGLAAGMKVVAVAHSYPPAKLSAAHRVVLSLEALSTRDLRGLFEPGASGPGR